LDFADDRGHAGVVRLTLAPAPAPASYLASLIIPGTGVVVVRDDDVPAPREGSLEIRADALWAEMICETPGEHWSFGLEAFGLRFDTAEEAAVSDVGDRVAVGLDLEWETPDRVVGDLLLASLTIPVTARGTFTTPD
jgi:hypothetical protein